LNEQLDPARPSAGEEVAVIDPGRAEHLHDAREQPLGADAHVHWFDRRPQGIDADHRTISRAQTAHCAATVIGQVDLIIIRGSPPSEFS
jgi:hypothetical protein